VHQPQQAYAAAWRSSLALLPPDDFPTTASVVNELSRVAGEEQFELGLSALVDGLLHEAEAATPGGNWALVATRAKQVLALDVDSTLPEVCGPTHIHLTTVVLDGKVQEGILDARNRTAFFTAGGGSKLHTFGQFLVLGIQHIATGYDHLSFLLGLLIATSSLRSLVKVVTSFTIAHSITLALATFDVVVLPSRFTESAIAASIVYVARKLGASDLGTYSLLLFWSGLITYFLVIVGSTFQFDFAVVLVIALVAVARWKGIASLAGLAGSIAVFLLAIVPAVQRGDDPLVATLAGALGVLVVAVFVVHGLNRKSVAALVGTVACLLIVVVLAALALTAAHMTGYGSEEAVFLAVGSAGRIDLHRLVLAGIVVGSLGALVDMGVGQASATFELAAAHEERF